jgi:hypothetical protein
MAHLGSDALPADGDGDLAMIVADDQLLDLLAGGGEPADGDDVSAMLAAWRTDVATDLPAVRRATPAVAPAVVARSPRRRRPISRTARTLLAAAAAVVVLAVPAAMAHDARPGSPLWPLTRVLYAEQAASAMAEADARQDIDNARRAIDAGRYTDAEKLLEDASARAGAVRDPGVAADLRAQIAALRQIVDGRLTGGNPSASGSTTGATGAPTTAPGGGPLPSGIQPTGVLPTGILPSGIVPTCVLPSGILPSGIVPGPILPSGVLPTCGG